MSEFPQVQNGWLLVDEAKRLPVGTLQPSDVPMNPGVYAFYRGNEAWYVGKAKCLKQRIWSNHSGRGSSMRSSALRRNVAEHLGFGTSADIKMGRCRLTLDQVSSVRFWLDECEIAWFICDTEAAASEFEKALKRESKPLLTKR